jgi:hypothetical protein
MQHLYTRQRVNIISIRPYYTLKTMTPSPHSHELWNGNIGYPETPSRRNESAHMVQLADCLRAPHHTVQKSSPPSNNRPKLKDKYIHNLRLSGYQRHHNAKQCPALGESIMAHLSPRPPCNVSPSLTVIDVVRRTPLFLLRPPSSSYHLWPNQQNEQVIS